MEHCATSRPIKPRSIIHLSGIWGPTRSLSFSAELGTSISQFDATRTAFVRSHRYIANLPESAPAKRLRWRLGERGKVVGAEPCQVKKAVAQCHGSHRGGNGRRQQFRSRHLETNFPQVLRWC